MRVLELKTNKQIEVNDSYGERLIQQGMAIMPPGVNAPKSDRESAARETRKKPNDADASSATEPKNPPRGDKATDAK